MQPETIVDDIQVAEANDFVKLAAGGPADGAPAPKQDTTDVAQAAETAPESETGDVKDDKGEHKKGGWQKRIDKLTARNYELEKELETERAKAAKPAEKTATEPPNPEVKPKLEDFKTHEEWVEAVADWKIEQRFAKEAQQAVQEEASDRTKEVYDAHNKRIAEAQGKYDDFLETVNVETPWSSKSPDDVQSAQAFQIAIYEAENGPDVLYYLGKNKEELAKLKGLSPAKVQMAVGRISASLLQSDSPSAPQEKTEEKPVTKAPPPIKPVGASGAKSTVNEDDLSDDEWIAQRNKAVNDRRKR